MLKITGKIADIFSNEFIFYVMHKKINSVLRLFFKFNLWFAFFLLPFTNTYSQNLSRYYSHLEEVKWFPRQSVRCLYQDSKGYLWVGTNAGLYRYNTVELKNFDMSTNSNLKFLSNTINDIDEDLDGNIVVATESGAGLINPLSNSKKIITLNDEYIQAVEVSKAGDIWFYNSQQQLYKFDNKQHKAQLYIDVRKIKGLERVIIRQLYFDDNGDLYLATSNGLYEVDQQSKTLLQTGVQQDVRSIISGYLGKKFIIKEDGLYALGNTDANTGYYNTQQLIPANNIKQVVVDFKNLIIASTANRVFAFNSHQKSNQYTSLVEDFILINNININTIGIDRSSNIWLGTQKGLYKIKKQKIGVAFYNKFAANELGSNVVNDIFYDKKGKIWVLNSSAGLYKFDIQTNAVTKFPLPYNQFNVVKRSGDGNIMLLGGQRMIEIFDSNNNSYKEYTEEGYPTDVTDMTEIFPGEWWITSWRKGLLRFRKPTSDVASEDLFYSIKRKTGNVHLFKIIKDRNNQVWLVSRGDGVFKLDLITKQIIHYKIGGEFSIPSNRIICIKEDSKGGIWIGTRGSGLLKYQSHTNSFKTFNTQSGLPSNTICSIVESSAGEIWVSTLNGIARYDANQLLPFYAYGLEDGIYNPEFNFGVGVSGPNNQLYFSSADGFYEIEILPGPEAEKPIPVVFTSFELLNKNEQDSASKSLLTDIFQHNKITLPASSSFSIGFAALDYTNPEKVQYAYKLVGKDENWRFITGAQSVIQYQNLDPGDYELQVKASNNRGEWENDPATLTIVVEASIWNHPIAWGIYILVFIFISIGVVYLWKRWYKLNKELKNEHEVAEKHQKQMVQFADLSHEIKNRLTLILGPLEEALQGKKVNQFVLHNLYDQAQRLKRLSDQIINIRKSEGGGYILNVAKENIYNHILTIAEDLKPLAIVKGVQLNFNASLAEEEGWYDKELVEIILLNVLGNAIKYSRVNGKVDFDVLLRPDEKLLMLKIKDDGIGIPKTDIKKILDPFYRAGNVTNNNKEFSGDGIGLNLVSRLIKIHHGIIEIESEPSVYTVVTLNIPINKDEYNHSELKPDSSNTPIVLPEDDNRDESIITPANGMLYTEDNVTGKVILVVDDDPQIRTMLRDALQTEFTIYEAEDGQAAMNILEKQPIDLVLSDLSMPNVDGLTLCIRIRQDKRFSHLPFLMLTARNSEEQQLVAFKYSVDDFIEKPFSLELIKWRIKVILRQQYKLENKIQKVIVLNQEIDESDSPDEIFIQKVVNLIDANINSHLLSVDFLAEEVGMSRATFYRKMEQLFGESPSNFIRRTRLKKAAAYIKSGKYNISEIAFKTGFKTPNYFTKCFQKEFGCTPTEYVENNAQ